MWSKAWVDMAEGVVREEFTKYKIPQVTAAAKIGLSWIDYSPLQYISHLGFSFFFDQND